MEIESNRAVRQVSSWSRPPEPLARWAAGIDVSRSILRLAGDVTSRRHASTSCYPLVEMEGVEPSCSNALGEDLRAYPGTAWPVVLHRHDAMWRGGRKGLGYGPPPRILFRGSWEPEPYAARRSVDETTLSFAFTCDRIFTGPSDQPWRALSLRLSLSKPLHPQKPSLRAVTPFQFLELPALQQRAPSELQTPWVPGRSSLNFLATFGPTDLIMASFDCESPPAFGAC